MKGLAHRLAARAAGTALAVRSDMRLPFGAGGWAEAVATQVDAASPAVASSLARAPVARTDPAGAAAVPVAELPATSMLAACAEPAALDEHEPAGRRIASQTSSEEQLPPRLLHEGRRLLARIEAPAQAAVEQTRLEPGVIAAPSASSVRQAAPVFAAVSSFRPDGADPARLMPAATLRQVPAAPIAVAGHPAWAAHSPAHSPALAAKAEEPTEVHVHIGRIDVTAVHEPAAARRRPAAAAAPMSLDTYLAKRSRS